MANRYRAFYEVIKKLKAEGVDINAIVVWSTIDSRSWLQSRSNVGGGTDGKQKQCPALFDDNYKAKPAYWAFVDPTQYRGTPEATEEPAVTEAPEATKAPTATEAPKVTEAPVVTKAPEATQTPVQDTMTTGTDSGQTTMFAVVGVVVVAAVAVGAVCIAKKKKK